MSSCIETGNVSSAEVLDEGVVDGVGLSGSHPSESRVGTTEEVIVGERLEDAGVVLRSNQGRLGTGELEAHTLDHPLGLDALEVGDIGDGLQGDSVVHPAQARLVPLLLGTRVGLDEFHGTNTTIDLETMLFGDPRGIRTHCGMWCQ